MEKQVLSYVLRLMLIKAMLFSIQNYRSSIFVLFLKVHKEIDAKLKDFFWVGAGLEKNKAKVAWDDICSSKEKGV